MTFEKFVKENIFCEEDIGMALLAWEARHPEIDQLIYIIESLNNIIHGRSIPQGNVLKVIEKEKKDGDA